MTPIVEGAPRIRVIAICVFRNAGRILVFEDFDSVKQSHYYRPLGGGVEFGETGKEAVIREIREELSAEITNVRSLGIMENLFTLEGKPGHQIVFVFDAEFADKTLYEKPFLEGYEHSADEPDFAAKWIRLVGAAQDGIRLVPEGLLKLLTATVQGGEIFDSASIDKTS